MPNSISSITSTIPGLDAVLGGALTTSDLIFVIGPPGAGKTVLASQIIFNAAQQGMQTLIITAYSEGPIKLLEHLRSFTFYDETLVGKYITIFTLAPLITANPNDIATTIIRTIRESGAAVVLIDGFQGSGNLMTSSEQIQSILSSLSSQLSYLKTTIILTLAGNARDAEMYAATTTADTTIGLSYTVQNRQHLRLLEVIKRRGHAQLSGQHAYRLDRSGMVIFPRLEVYPIPVHRPRPQGRILFGLPELDKLLGGGLNAGTTTILAGAPGVGKTVLALYWSLTDARAAAKTLYLTFREHTIQLEEKAATFSLDLVTAQAAGVVDVLRFEPNELHPDLLAQQLLDALLGTGTQRLVIDDIAPLIQALGERAPSFLSALSAHIYAEGITALVLYEINPLDGFRINLTDSSIGIFSDNLIIIQQQEVSGALRRLLAVLRMRFSDYDRTIRELLLDPRSIRVLTPEESNPSVLKAAATASGSVAPASVDGHLASVEQRP